jgi:uncharacterized protein YkwD
MVKNTINRTSSITIIVIALLVTAAILTVQSSPSSMLQPSYSQLCPDGSPVDASGNCPTDAPPAGDEQTAQAPPATETPPPAEAPPATETPPPATEAPPATETPPPAEAPPATETPDTTYGAYGTKEAYCEVYHLDAECQEAPPPSKCEGLSLYECNALTTTPFFVNKSSLAYLTGYQSALLYNFGAECQSLSNTPQADSQNRTAQEDCTIGYVGGITAMQNPTFQQTADFVKGMLELHNRERAAVGSPPIVWSDTLAAESKAWAEHLSPTGVLVHDYGNVEGENIAEDLASGPTNWVHEKDLIPQKYQGGPVTQFFESLSQNDQFTAGHYFNMVWPTWKAVGCGTAQNPYPIVVCRFTERSP